MTVLDPSAAVRPGKSDGHSPIDTVLRDPGSRVVPAVVAVSVCLLPFLSPPGSGNTAPADLGIGTAIVLATLWVAHQQLTLSFPYAVGVCGLMVGGALAALVAGAPLSTVLVLVQDLALLLWAAVLTLGRHRVAIVAAATKAWTLGAPVYATVMLTAYLTGVNSIAGVSADDGVRASYTFGDPNLAGNFLVMSLFMMAACARPRRRAVRLYGYTVIVVAISFTGSNGAMLTLCVGVVLALAAQRFRTGGVLAGLAVIAAVATLTVTLVGFVLPRVDVDGLRQQAANSIPLLRDSVARSGNSSGERATILQEGMKRWFEGDLTGYGPGQTKARLEAVQSPYPKEAHNDYLAALLERGVIGVLGLVALVVAIGVRCLRLVTCDLPEAYARLIPRWWLLGVIGPVMAVAGTFYEVLHFRHLWTWLGLVAALCFVSLDRRRKAR